MLVALVSAPGLAAAQPTVPAVPSPPAVPTAPAVPAVPAAPTVPTAPTLPTVPTVPALPSSPALPSEPAPAAPPTAPATAPRTTISPPEDATGDLDTDPPKPAVPHQLARGDRGGALELQEMKSTGITIEEIVNLPIVSASSRKESALSAPAHVIVLTAKDLRARGYTDLSQILDDMPGMDVVRPYGDVYVKSYWRGYRPGAGADPYLVMLDGMVMNQLFFGDTQIFATFPISSIERVEIVYGPASAVYGPNAEMGVINVITKDRGVLDDSTGSDTSLDSRITWGGPQRNLSSFDDTSRIVDATLQYRTKRWGMRLSTRIEDSVLDRSIGREFEYTKPGYYADGRIWGAPVLAAYPDMMGKFRSPDRKRAVDARLYLGESTEIGGQFFQLSTGLGTRYAADRFQTATPWTTNELSAFARHSTALSASVTSTTLVQYRRSDVASPSSSFGRSFADPGPYFVTVEAPNSAYIVQQDFDAAAGRNLVVEGDDLRFTFGIKYQHLDLSRDYQSLTNVLYPLDVADPVGGALDSTSPSAASDDGRQRLTSEASGAYLLARYGFPKANALHGGVRWDYTGLTDDSNVTFRGGYVGTFGDVTAKLLYGQAVYAPSAFDLARATTTLKEERSQTLEANAQWTIASAIALSGDIYNVSFTDPIVAGGANGAGSENLATRRMVGATLGARLLAHPFEVWGYYSRYLKADESSAADRSVHAIGDLARDKVWAGATYDRGPLTASVYGRWIGPRAPVATNPLGTVPAYFTLDANVIVSHIGVEGAWLGLRAANLLDARYSQPGMETAGSGATQGVFGPTGYVGSQDDFNSRLPQPRRSIFFTLGLDT